MSLLFSSLRLLVLLAAADAFAIRPANSVADFSSRRIHQASARVPISAPRMMLQGDSGEADILAPLVVSSEFWSAAIMCCIVALLYTWEETVKTLREKLPQTLMPVVDSMLAEMGGLGFIGLFLSTFVTGGPLGHTVEHISEEYLGDGEILLETFEFLHTAFFEVGIGFFLISGLTVFKVLKKVESLTAVSEAIFDRNEDGEICLEELAEVLQVESLLVDIDCDGSLSENEITNALRATEKASFLDEVFMSTAQVKAEALVVRERLMRILPLRSSFRVEEYFERVFGGNLREIVELSPIAWLPLIPPISIGRSVDMSRGIVSASSPNAAESCGYFLGTSSFIILSSVFVWFGFGWCIWNFWKMSQIKEMLVPPVVRDTSNGEATILPPRYKDELLLEQFDSSPSIFGWLESTLCGGADTTTPTNDHERLFGAAGCKGPDFYRNSIKLHTWLVVSQIVFFGGQIVLRDAAAMFNHWQNVGNPELLRLELALFTFYVAVAAGQLALAPQTFLNYCLVTSVETFAENAVAKEESMKVYLLDEEATSPTLL